MPIRRGTKDCRNTGYREASTPASGALRNPCVSGFIIQGEGSNLQQHLALALTPRGLELDVTTSITLDDSFGQHTAKPMPSTPAFPAGGPLHALHGPRLKTRTVATHLVS
jgi:hypothetical protein